MQKDRVKHLPIDVVLFEKIELGTGHPQPYTTYDEKMNKVYVTLKLIKVNLQRKCLSHYLHVPVDNRWRERGKESTPLITTWGNTYSTPLRTDAIFWATSLFKEERNGSISVECCDDWRRRALRATAEEGERLENPPALQKRPSSTIV